MNLKPGCIIRRRRASKAGIHRKVCDRYHQPVTNNQKGQNALAQISHKADV